MTDPVAHQEAEKIAREIIGRDDLSWAGWYQLAPAYLDLLAQLREAQRRVAVAEDALCPLPLNPTEIQAATEVGETDPYFVLRFCRGAIEDAIGNDDGLDGAAGEAVLKMIAASLASQKSLAAQLREAEKLREFVEWCMATASWQGYDLHGGDMQDKAEELGLLVQVPADEAFREEYEADEMFVVAWSPLAARRADTPTEEGK